MIKVYTGSCPDLKASIEDAYDLRACEVRTVLPGVVSVEVRFTYDDDANAERVASLREHIETILPAGAMLELRIKS